MSRVSSRTLCAVVRLAGLAFLTLCTLGQAALAADADESDLDAALEAPIEGAADPAVVADAPGPDTNPPNPATTAKPPATAASKQPTVPTPDIFRPTEDISEDLAVKFPVDI